MRQQTPVALPQNQPKREANIMAVGDQFEIPNGLAPNARQFGHGKKTASQNKKFRKSNEQRCRND